MSPLKIAERIEVDPKVLGSKPTIRGLRISVEQVLKALAAGVPQEELLREHPELEPEDIRAALAYAAEVVGIRSTCGREANRTRTGAEGTHAWKRLALPEAQLGSPPVARSLNP